MLSVPNTVLNAYAYVLNKNEIAGDRVGDYKKWLRYYLDFCDKYPGPDAKSERVRLFCEKLRDKKQTEQQQQQAVHAISLYFEMQKQTSRGEAIREPNEVWLPVEKSTTATAHSPQPAGDMRVSQYCAAGYQEKTDSPEWDAVLATLAAEIKVRHYSRKTLKAYAKWSRQFQRFLKNKPPQELTTADVKEYLTFLAVKCNVAASTQNQAFRLD